VNAPTFFEIFMQETVTEISKNCYLRAIKLLSMREYSEKKLRTKLEHLEYQKEIIDLAVDELKAKNYLQDERFKEMKCRSLLRTGLGAEQIIPRLKEEGIVISRNEIDSMREDLGINVDDQVAQLIEQKLAKSTFKKVKEEYKLVSKLYQHLISKGFRVSIEQIKSAVRASRADN
jgi:regulatory protein